MNNAAEARSDILTILLCNRIHSDLNVKSRAIKVAKTCKQIRDRTKDKGLYDLCRTTIKAVSQGHYHKTLEIIQEVEVRGLS